MKFFNKKTYNLHVPTDIGDEAFASAKHPASIRLSSPRKMQKDLDDSDSKENKKIMSDFEMKLAELKERIDVYKILFLSKKPKFQNPGHRNKVWNFFNSFRPH